MRHPAADRRAGACAHGAWVLPLLFWSLPASAQTIGLAPDDDVSSWRVLAVLLLGVLLAVAAAFALRSRIVTRGGIARGLLRPSGIGMRRLRLVERLRLGPQVDLYIVLCDDRELLIAASGQSVQLIDRLGPPGEAAP
jgi:flagellar biogenesis protein FliO